MATRDPYPYRGQPSEARDILNALATAGMQRAAIAQALQVRARKLADITAGKTNGATISARLRALYDASRVQFGEKLPALPVRSPLPSAPAPAPIAPIAPSVDPSTVPLTAAVDAADLPPDERTTGERVRGKLRDFLMGKDGATAVIDAAERKQSGKASASSALDDRQARFVEQISPIVGLAIMIVGWLAWPDPYKECAPTQPEGEAMIRPILRIAARQLEIAGQLSENTVDLLASLAAVALYAQRGWDTFKEIRRGDERSERHQRQRDARRGDVAAPAALHFASQSTSADRGHQASGGQPGGAAGAAGDARDAENGEAPPDEQRRAAALLDGVLAADADGRRRLALN
ncbi:MAG TPA: hypothetical protein VF116_16250 [Ktedonobacterales bacterium]